MSYEGSDFRGQMKLPGLSATFLFAAAAFAFVYVVGLVLVLSAPMLLALREHLSDTIKLALHHPTLPALTAALSALTGFTAITLVQPFGMIAAFLLIEIWLGGPPKSWATTLRSLFYRAVEAMANTFVALIFARIAALLLPGPLFTLDAGHGANVFVTTGWTAALVILALALQDFGFYWAHRFQHRFRTLWRFHAVHHSIEHLDAANNYLHPIDHMLPQILVGAIGAVIGLNYEAFLIVSVLMVVHDHLIHSRAPVHLGRFRALVVDNRYHHFHHSRNYEHYNKNFSAYLTLWDRVFGTCHIPADDEMPETGIVGTKPAPTLWRYLTADLRGTGEDMAPPERQGD